MTSEKFPKYKNLVFEGGSVKGVAYVGALDRLVTDGFDLLSIENVAGTSAGAITAVFIALNYPMEELIKIFVNCPFGSFLDSDSWFGGILPAPKIPSSMGSSMYSNILSGKRMGFFKGDKLLEWIESFVEERTGIKNCTFKEMNELGKFKNLSTIGYNLSKRKSQVFNFKETPNAVISHSIRISASFPILFSPHNYMEKIDGELVPNSSDIWTDGGIVDNYPIHLFKSEEFGETLGFSLVSKNEKDYYDGLADHPGFEINTTYDFIRALVEVGIFGNQDMKKENSWIRKRTVFIYHQDIEVHEFNLGEDKKNLLFKSGWESCEKFFNLTELPVPLISEKMLEMEKEKEKAKEIEMEMEKVKEMEKALDKTNLSENVDECSINNSFCSIM